MALKARFKFPNTIAFTQELRLINDAGFRVNARKRGDDGFIILEKVTEKVAPKPPAFEVLINGELPQAEQDALRRRCNTILSMYDDPIKSLKDIEIRINNIAETLPTHRKKFVKLWAQNNLHPENLV